METLNVIRKGMQFSENVLNKVSFVAPLLARAVVGYTFYLTGKGKLGNLEGVTDFFTSLGIPAPHAHAVFVSGLECFGGLLLIAGLFTRPIAALLGGTMVVALITADRAGFLEALQGSGDKGLTDVAPVVLGMFLLYLLCYGPGLLSLDHILKRVLKLNPATPPRDEHAGEDVRVESLLQQI